MLDKKKQPSLRRNQNKTDKIHFRVNPDLKSRYADALTYLDMKSTDHLTSCVLDLIEQAEKKKRTEGKNNGK